MSKFENILKVICTLLRKQLSRVHPHRIAMWFRRQIWKKRILVGQVLELNLHRRVKIMLYTDSKLCELIFLHDFERAEREFVGWFLRPGDVFVDVGANIGLFTLIGAQIVGRRGHVFAFEPCASTYRRLQRNISLNRFDNVTCCQLALSDRSGTESMVTSLDGYDAWNSLGKPSEGKSFATEVISCTTWDEFADQHGVFNRVTLMKIDVEGWESFVLSGGAREFRQQNSPVLIVEFTETNCAAIGLSCASLYQLLQSFGYTMYSFDSRSRDIEFSPLQEHYPYTNLLAIKDPEAVRSRLRYR